MIALIQRVREAHVTIDSVRVGRIGPGLVALVAAVPDDTEQTAQRLAERVLAYRIFADEQGRMNHGAIAVGAGVLAVPQFTLAADTRRGNRPGFSRACPPDRAAPLFDTFVAELQQRHAPIETGRFGADMQVGLVNDGPVTFWLESY
ncbi:D-aminoacyl-tRNA deacylase [Salinisphaera sp. Q1T1-3]|uniref:D-aminoacyl-tRNA deacylase n=1 Tax=Salinisphaera sp. Q1T1-3 TaxID=2321229 RepID=UPI000E73959A|nr:D-aminoacyl-tRNA deacylase [Salinisphaera sp. Q1T1-3]RJS91248.1 D-tyrosyl-tRNA(Tyr) deacylase [Salinisphaera sp. Q1T1-3]